MKIKISTTEFYIIGFLSSMLFMSSLTSNALADNISDSIFAAFLSALVGLLLSMPLFLSKQKNNEKSAVDLIYAVYFIACDIIILSQIQNMFTNTIYPDTEPFYLGVFVLSVASYGAIKGVQAVARSSILVFCFFVLCFLFITMGAASLMNTNNLEVVFYNGYSDSIKNAISIFARSSVLPQLVILFRFVNKELGYSFYIWQGISWLVVSAAFLIIMLSLGRFSSIQMYPFYCLSSVTSLGPIRRMDIVFSMMWISALIVRFAVDLVLIKECVKEYIYIKYSSFIVPTSSSIILVLSYVVLNSGLMHIVTIISIYLPVLIFVLGFAVPLYYLLKNKA